MCQRSCLLKTVTLGVTNTTRTAEPYDTENIREDLYFRQAKNPMLPISQPSTHHRNKSENIIPLLQWPSANLKVFRRGHSVLESLTQYPALASFRDTSRRKTKMSVITKMATQLPMMRPR